MAKFPSTHFISKALGNLETIDMAKAGAYSAHTFFFFFFLSPKLSYVPFVLARDHLGKLVMEK